MWALVVEFLYSSLRIKYCGVSQSRQLISQQIAGVAWPQFIKRFSPVDPRGFHQLIMGYAPVDIRTRGMPVCKSDGIVTVTM